MYDLSSYEKLPHSFYEHEDVVQIAQDLLGKYLFTNIDGIISGAKIVESEAYNGRTDKACHAFHKRTPRTEVMYGYGGTAYVYLCYGIHHLFNVVTNQQGLADAVLIRGVHPILNVEVMQERRGSKIPRKKISSGPGMLSQAMGISTALNGVSLNGDQIWIASHEHHETFEIVTDVRIGVDYAEEDALLPWRFYVKDNPFVSVK